MQQYPSCFPVPMGHCLVFAKITVCGTSLWTKWGNESILRITLPKWGGVVVSLGLTESDPAFWNWISISKLIHSVAPQIVVLKNQRGQWAKGGMRMNNWGWMNKVCLKVIFMSNIFYYETYILRVQFVIYGRPNQLQTIPILQWRYVCL